ncbi:MAG TPA: hypothetical protein VFQ15_06765 [Jiangellaceae bacterium]|nr:hypothetical protein [Jiangellaceae bacterium]
MPSHLTTIKVDTDVRDQLAVVARARHTTMRALLADVAGRLQVEQRWSDIDAGYARLLDDPGQWADYRNELQSWETGSDDTDNQAAAEWPEYSE